MEATASDLVSDSQRESFSAATAANFACGTQWYSAQFTCKRKGLWSEFPRYRKTIARHGLGCGVRGCESDRDILKVLFKVAIQDATLEADVLSQPLDTVRAMWKIAHSAVRAGAVHKRSCVSERSRF